jgi:NAD(P)-dependent dehydrogenase (short-subunit alcohol dehydrogenase family)
MEPRRILIIGNSSGIGAAVAQALVERGDRVTGVSRSRSPLPEHCIRHEVLDVTSSEYPRLLERLVQESDGFDACIYCVGIGSNLELPDLSMEGRVFDVNLTAMVRTMAVLAPGWIERRCGHFIGLSSLADAFYNSAAPSYSASKAGFSNYLASMALALRPSGITVTNVRFGFVDTKMAQASKKPLMMSAPEAAAHVLRCLDRRPARLSVPKVAAAATWVIGVVQSVRVWLA